MKCSFFPALGGLLVLAALMSSASAEVLVRDGGVEITREEFEAIMADAPESIKARAANDLAERLELLNGLLYTRKLAAEADKINEGDPDYWALQFALIGAKQQFMLKKLREDIVEPDFEPLARERYDVQRDKYAKVPEYRASSHILLRSPPGLDRTEVRAKANTILEQLRAGADFEATVEEYSEDPGSKQRGGSLNRYIRFGDPDITPPYSEALFKIEAIGEYSEVTDSQFGVHIIRLDDIRASTYASYEDVKNVIIEDLRKDFLSQAGLEIRARYNVTEDLYIDGPAMEEFFAPFKQEQD